MTNLLVIRQGELTISEVLFCIPMLIIMINSFWQILKIFKARFTGRDDFENDGVDEFDIYGHRTAASYEKQRLRKLDDLYRSNLISQAEYEEKRNEIIKNLWRKKRIS